ncbi:MAG: stage IV sporulation protein A [Eubacteriales bacterium]
MDEKTIYEQIGQRTDGNVYVSVVGPVRTGKSTFIKRLMEELVIPNIENQYRRERARDELPQSGSGKTIMTAEPKFVPEEAVEISPDGLANLSVRLIDSVGYMVEGAMGADEDGNPRMVTTPWFDQEIPMTQAAELGTKKVMESHGTIGIVITTDGTITDIPRADYIEAEGRAITDMEATGKPFVVLVNSVEPGGEVAQKVVEMLQATYGITAMAVNCLTLQEGGIRQILNHLLYQFPMSEVHFYLPSWVESLEYDHPMKVALFQAMGGQCQSVQRLSQLEPAVQAIGDLDCIAGYQLGQVDLGSGVVVCTLTFLESLFYEILGEKSGFTIENDGQLFSLLEQLALVKQEYDKVAKALEQVRATGYGVVSPTGDEIMLEPPEIVKKGNTYGVRMKASAPSIHMMQVGLKTEINPMVGDEKQSEDMHTYLMGEYDAGGDQLWESTIFGRSVAELVGDGMSGKLQGLSEDSRYKIKDALTKIVNEGASGLICIMV